MVVVALLGILASMAAVQLKNSPDKAREAVLKTDLHVMREAIDQYFADKARYPASLDALVEEGYLRSLPVDPFTKDSTSWRLVQAGEAGPGSEDLGLPTSRAAPTRRPAYSTSIAGRRTRRSTARWSASGEKAHKERHRDDETSHHYQRAVSGTAAFLVAAVFGIAACNNSDPTAPADSTVTLTANPTTVVSRTMDRDHRADGHVEIQERRPGAGPGNDFSTTSGLLDPVAGSTILTDDNGQAMSTLTLTSNSPPPSRHSPAASPPRSRSSRRRRR